MPDKSIAIRVGHSPDPDDAFMFYALAKEKIHTGQYRFTHQLVDIETLNQKASRGELELTAISFHAYAFVHNRYILCRCGASMGDGYGPIVVARSAMTIHDLKDCPIAIPGRWTSAFLALQIFLRDKFPFVIVPFDKIPAAVATGGYRGQAVGAGLLIHEGQLTFQEQGLKPIVDLGTWWKEQTGLPLPLGGNAIRRDLGEEVISDVHRLLRQSIEYALAHRTEALNYALAFARDLDPSLADRFVEMYVNHWTQDLGEAGRESVRLFLEKGYELGAIPELIVPEFVPIQ
ncbi:MAG: menaquinone biosynthesis family protein [Thermogutta sp.]